MNNKTIWLVISISAWFYLNTLFYLNIFTELHVGITTITGKLIIGFMINVLTAIPVVMIIYTGKEDL